MLDGIRIVELGGNSTTRPKSQSTRYPALTGSKSPEGMIEHQPCTRLLLSVCGILANCLAKLKVL